MKNHAFLSLADAIASTPFAAQILELDFRGPLHSKCLGLVSNNPFQLDKTAQIWSFPSGNFLQNP